MLRVNPTSLAGKVTVLALALSCAACAAPAVRVAEPDLAPIEGTRADATPWWEQAGDPVLAQVIAQGLAHDPALACQAWTLHADADRATARRRQLGGRMAGLFGKVPVLQGPPATAYAHAALVNRRAAAIGEAYLAVRLAQARLVARNAAVAPWKDNTDIARFRREAGLVSAIDSALGGVMVDLDADAVTQAQAEVALALTRLAEQTGIDTDALVTLLGEGGPVPALADIAAPEPRRAGLMVVRQEQGQAVLAGKATLEQARAALASATAASNIDIDSATKALAAAHELVEASARTLTQADRTVRDARAGYRAGAEPFATLYVAEASALAASEADASARTGLARAQIRLWTAQGLGWTLADLAPAAPAQAPSRCPAQP